MTVIEGRKSGAVPKSIDPLKRFMDIIKTSPVRRAGIHVSSLKGDCMRQSYLRFKSDTDGFEHNDKTLISFWIGRELHKTKILSHHEVNVDWNGILGRCDEYENGVLLDKKTCRKIPERPWDNDVKQLEYYALMLTRTGKCVKRSYVLYIDVANCDVKLLAVRMRPFTVIERELLKKRDLLKMAIANDVLPPKVLNWACETCAFKEDCLDADDFKWEKCIDKRDLREMYP